MIDWEATAKQYGYTSAADLKTKRPKVVCLCDSCGKSRTITVRVKSKIIDNNLPWKCASCVCLGITDTISTNMRQNWSKPEYRNNQITIKNDNNYRLYQSSAITQLWKKDAYRNKLQVGIRSSPFINKCLAKFKGQFTYDIGSFKDWRLKIKIHCNSCGSDFYCRPLQHLAVGYCPTCHSSAGQRDLADFVKDLGISIICNDKQTVPGIELDINAGQLAIEYHGLFWHSYNTLESNQQKLRHQNKAIVCAKHNVKLLQFFDFEWRYRRPLIESMIAHRLGFSKAIHARKLQVILIGNNQCADFFNTNHLQGHRPASFIAGLTNGNEIISAMSFSKSKNGFEIIRYATKQGLYVVGGAGRLLSFFKKTHRTSPVYTFADLRYSSGNVYRSLGFELIKTTHPGYFYYRQKGTKYIIHSRQRCQKHRLIDLLGDGYDPSLSESLNMFNNGFRRVWDAGHLSFILP